jgi:hypothetical protein
MYLSLYFPVGVSCKYWDDNISCVADPAIFYRSGLPAAWCSRNSNLKFKFPRLRNQPNLTTGGPYSSSGSPLGYSYAEAQTKIRNHLMLEARCVLLQFHVSFVKKNINVLMIVFDSSFPLFKRHTFASLHCKKNYKNRLGSLLSFADTESLCHLNFSFYNFLNYKNLNFSITLQQRHYTVVDAVLEI